MMEKLVLVQKAISKVFGDFVAKAVSDSVDVLKSAIRDADLDRKSYNQNLQTRLYQLMIDALNRFTHNNYRNQDKLYDAAESIIKGYISTQDNVDAVKAGLKMLVSDVNNDTCQEFLETLCGEICSDDNSDLYKEIDMLWKRRESEYIRGEFAKIGQNDREIFEHLNDLKEVLDFIKRNMNRQEGDKAEYNGIPIVNRADEYAKRWNENVFLNNFNQEDQHAGINIKLREIYVEECLPHYIWGSNTQSSDKLKKYLMKYINDNEKKMLLILGQPGIGKSTLITWIMANLVENEEQILVYQFASDLGKVNWQSDNTLDNIFKIIGYSYRELEGKTLILDGFDEIHVNNDRERILHKLKQELENKNYLKKFSLIITCRENYVDETELKAEYITLQAWGEKQIKSFCETYEKENTKNNCKAVNNKNLEAKINKIIENKEIFGIPLILYMVLALNIDIEKNSSKMDIYDQIFLLRGGIYDRCIKNKNYASLHRISTIKKQIHQISQRIAFWMFENNADKASIPQEKFKEICDAVISGTKEKNEDMQRDVLIGNYFAPIKHCEGVEADELQFVHRSIYEYFVVIYFFESIKKVKDSGNNKIKGELEELLKTGYLSKQISEFVAGKLGELLKDGELSEQILEFIKYKFDSMKGYHLSDVTKEVFNILLRDGMTYHIGMPCKNAFEREMNIFANMLKAVGLWNPLLGEVDDKIVIYLQCNRKTNLNLKGAYLRGAYLSGANLKGADLREAYLRGAYLRRANLNGANLSGAYLIEANLSGAYLIEANLNGANLSGANLSGANLNGADLRKANLRGAYLRRAYLREADLRGAYLSRTDLNEVSLSRTIFNEEQVNLLCKEYDLSDSRVYQFKTEEIISYKDFCKKRKQNT